MPMPTSYSSVERQTSGQRLRLAIPTKGNDLRRSQSIGPPSERFWLQTTTPIQSMALKPMMQSPSLPVLIQTTRLWLAATRIFESSRVITMHGDVGTPNQKSLFIRCQHSGKLELWPILVGVISLSGMASSSSTGKSFVVTRLITTKGAVEWGRRLL